MSRLPLRCYLALFSLLAAPANLWADGFPEPYDSEPDKTAAPPTADEALGMIQLPEGFSATVFAAEPEVRNPIAMAWDHRGRMWVAENFTYAERKKRFDLELRDRILIFEDEDGDGRADGRRVFADDLTMLTSVEVGDGGVWAMCPPRLLFFPDADGDDQPDGAPVVKLDGFEVAKNNYHNFANGLRWGPDGWLYGRCGHSCPGQLGKPGTPAAKRIPMEGGIWRYHPQREVVEVVTHGTTNPWGHDWDRHGQLFFINTVNGHLWHGIPGAHFKESFGASPNPGVFERLDMHADHWHYDTGQHWTKSRDGKANDFGGGHAHIGMMIYQGDQWPEAMRDRLYTLNMHGLRTNVERLERHGSGYVGRHEDDVFFTGDKWFRGIDIQQGPDGSAYLLDWSDTGECHDHSGVHRSSGRIYRISRGNPTRPDLRDLEELTPDGIRRLILEPNVWYERQLRRRIAAETGCEEVLNALLKGAYRSEVRLRALWALNQIGKAQPGLLAGLLADPDEHLRCWAIRLLLDRGDHRIDTIMGPRDEPAPFPQIDRVVSMAKSDSSGLVLLTLASSLQRLSLQERGQLGAALVTRVDYADDHNLPSMVWYGLIPLAGEHVQLLIEIAQACSWPDTFQWITRSIASLPPEAAGGLERLMEIASRRPEMRRPLLQGTVDAYKGRKQVDPPSGWPAFAAASRGDEGLLELTLRLDLLFGREVALVELRETATDGGADIAQRKRALGALIAARSKGIRQLCETLLDDAPMAAMAARGLAMYDDPELGAAVAGRYLEVPVADRGAMMEVLVSRAGWAAAVLDRIASGEIPRSELAAFHARQIRSFASESLDAKLAEAWGQLRESPAEKRELIGRWRETLTPQHLAGADLGRGRVLFQNTCGACHKMYGEGGAIGPDLTGSGRKDLGYLLENIADPSAVVSADYRMSTLTLKDGRIVTGVVASSDDALVTLRQIAGELTVARGSIAKREISPVSMMPDGLLEVLGDDQVRDLIAYLQHPQQVPLPRVAPAERERE